jgi:hypothetical protein
MFRSYDHLQVEIYTSEINMTNSVSIVVYNFIQIIRYMFRSYDHLQVKIYTLASHVNSNVRPSSSESVYTGQ